MSKYDIVTHRFGSLMLMRTIQNLNRRGAIGSGPDDRSRRRADLWACCLILPISAGRTLETRRTPGRWRMSSSNLLHTPPLASSSSSPSRTRVKSTIIPQGVTSPIFPQFRMCIWKHCVHDFIAYLIFEIKLD